MNEDLLEVLAMVSEECGEVVQAIGKALRHGIDDWNPVTGIDNKDAIVTELADVIAVAVLLLEFLEIPQSTIDANYERKFTKLLEYTHSEKLIFILETFVEAEQHDNIRPRL